MNKLTKNTLLVVALLLLLGIAGRCDYNESVIYNMPDNVYRIKDRVGQSFRQSVS